MCGWGAHGAIGDRGVGVLRALERHQVRPHALSLTAKGHPGHPLYLRGDLEPFPIEAADPAAGAMFAAVLVETRTTDDTLRPPRRGD